MWEWIERLGKYEISINEFLTLYTIYSDINNTKNINYEVNGPKDILSLEEKLMIKILRSESGEIYYNIRQQGVDIIKEMGKAPRKEIPISRVDLEHFTEFWEAFPSSDEHGHYRKTRMLKASKEACKKIYYMYLKQGTVHSDIIRALKYQIDLKKSTSGKSNDLSYMKNTLTWLRSKEFEIILELIEDTGTDSIDEDWTSKSV